MKSTLLKSIFLINLLTIVIHVEAQRVSAYQAGAYYPGLASVRDFGAVPSGLYILDYNYWMKSKGYYDKNGNKFEGGKVDLPSGASKRITDPEINTYLNSAFIFYASKFNVLGAKYLASISPLYINSKYNAFMSLGDTSANVSGEISGIGDLSFMPIGLSWTKESKMDVSFFYTIYAPTGKFELGASDNLGQGFWAHQLQLPTYFYFLEQSTALAVIPTLELNNKLKNTDFKAGHRFSLEYGISQYLTSWLEVELLNGHNWQIQDDSGSDNWWDGTQFDSRDKKNTFSVGVGVWPIEGVLNLRAKYITDYGVQQRFQNRLWSFSFLYIPGLLKD
jgi:hypothetical protein